MKHAQKKAAARRYEYRYTGPTITPDPNYSASVGLKTGTTGRIESWACPPDAQGRKMVDFVPSWGEGFVTIRLPLDHIESIPQPADVRELRGLLR